MPLFIQQRLAVSGVLNNLMAIPAPAMTGNLDSAIQDSDP